MKKRIPSEVNHYGHVIRISTDFAERPFHSCVVDNDSFIAFEEILVQARRHDVDFILLGGDLFHDANPSQSAINRYV